MLQTKTITRLKIPRRSMRYSVEFFHIYSDDKIKDEHTKSIEYLKAVQDVWTINADTVVMIDDYNAKKISLTQQEVVAFLASQHVKPDYWTHESKLVNNAEVLLGHITDKRLKRSYERYIAAHQKYPCSLLTAAWYLTRLGALNNRGVLRSTKLRRPYKDAQRLINILPKYYKPIELKALKIISNSTFKHHTDKIQALFYDAETPAALDLF